MKLLWFLTLVCGFISLIFFTVYNWQFVSNQTIVTSATLFTWGMTFAIASVINLFLLFVRFALR